MSAARVSRIGLPLSSVSAMASVSRFASMRSAIFKRMLERSATEVRPHFSRAAWAASSASSTSSACERATWHSTSPLIGLILSKYCPPLGATHFPPMKLSYFERLLFLRRVSRDCWNIVSSWGSDGLAVRYFIVGITKLWSVTGPPLGQRWVTVFTRVKKRTPSEPYWLRSPKPERFQPPKL